MSRNESIDSSLTEIVLCQRMALYSQKLLEHSDAKKLIRRVASNKEDTERRVSSGQVEVITSKILRSPPSLGRPSFVGHNFRSKWHTDQLKYLIENLPTNKCLVVHDFSENYRCTDSVEIQSNYFQRTEVSIQVSLIYRHAILKVDGVSNTPEEINIICEHFYIISPDEKRNQYFVHYVQKSISEYLNSINYYVTVMHEFCDSCQCQYKSRNCFGNFAESVEEFGYSKIIRNFFESCLGKGPQDAAGGLLKNHADMVAIRGKAEIRSARELFEFAENNLKTSRSHACKRRLFRYVEEIPRANKRNFKPIKGVRAVHRVETIDSQNLLLRNLSCYCDHCLECEECMNIAQVRSCTVIELVGDSTNSSYENTFLEREQNESIADLITEGTIFAVLCDDDGHDFYLLKATSESIILEENESDEWGASFSKGSLVLRGMHFAKKNFEVPKYKLLKRSLAIAPTASVLYICQDYVEKTNFLTLTKKKMKPLLNA